MKIGLIGSYPVTWYCFSTKKRHKRGFFRVFRNKRTFFRVGDDKREVYLPINILDFIISDLKSRGHYFHILPSQQKQFMYDYNGLKKQVKFKQFKWEKSPSGRSKHYSDKYLKYMARHHPDKMVEAEEKELRWRIRNKRLK